ncbi:hypothetical protein [Aquimarina sp. 2201CG5-10]|uniref:hypothetical protein n=1 Tax=Aquimarina callyspongiae TaxID=3098150 RepID=UPI002AB35A60|nr:hypothetical protein [Aquimarina sp. 2201CG5-10]MDY8138616.1 hypothetical protein [Aquimarina sp. 2201CG5-10]
MLKNILKLEGVEILVKNQLKSINGGSMTCSCRDIPGTWTGSYANEEELQDAVNQYCSSGARCRGTYDSIE